MNNDTRERLLELMADRVTGDLDRTDRPELAQLERDHPEIDPFELEYAAAAATLALLDEEATLPEDLRDRLLAERADGATIHRMPRRHTSDSSSPSVRSSLGWLAAAAMLILALAGWWPESRQPTARERMAMLQQEAGDLVVVDFAATEDPYAEGAKGQVLWSNARQEGYMRIRGLHANDADQDQYQLWIFDKQRNDAFPVDGGVFDMDPVDGEAIIPIDARLAVNEPFLFAVTVEQPGGVVVSDRERIVLAAQL